MENRSRYPDSSFFFKLLWAFFLTGMLPLCIISFTTLLYSRHFVDTAYREGLQETVNSAAGLTEYLISEAEKKSMALLHNEYVVRYFTDDNSRNFVSTRITQELSRIAESGYYETYVIPLDRSVLPLGRFKVPSAYTIPQNVRWGILGSLSENDGTLFSVFAQPHFDRIDPIPFAVGIPVMVDNSVAGYIITDIKREAFSDFFGVNVSRLGAIKDLFITDKTGCVLFSLLGTDREGRFFDQLVMDISDCISVARTVTCGIAVTGFYPRSAMAGFAARINSLTMMLAVICFVCALVFSFFISRSISKPVSRLAYTMRQVENGDLSVQCPVPQVLPFFNDKNDDIRFLIERFNYMVQRINILMHEAVLKQKYLRIAEVRSLQSQMNPHFLYNTLSSIRSIAKLQGADDAADMVTILARILRERISVNKDMSTIRESVLLARDYFLIESYRWPGRFTYKESIDDSVAEVPVPKLMIQPVVENALVHGLEKKQGPGILEIQACRSENMVVIRIMDNGCGISGDTLAALKTAFDSQPSENEQYSFGIALVNTHRRLRLLYGPQSGLSIFPRPSGGTCVEIRFIPEHIPDV